MRRHLKRTGGPSGTSAIASIGSGRSNSRTGRTAASVSSFIGSSPAQRGRGTAPARLASLVFDSSREARWGGGGGDRLANDHPFFVSCLASTLAREKSERASAPS